MLYIGKLIVENDIVKPFYRNRIIQKGNKIMEFSVKGIGIIKEADIKIDGLTVIAGSKTPGRQQLEEHCILLSMQWKT